MKKSILKYLLALILSIFVFSILLITLNTKEEKIKYDLDSEESYDPDEHPTMKNSSEEILINENYAKKASLKGNLEMNAIASSSYAEGVINGTWSNVEFLTSGNGQYVGDGYRVDGSLYDKENDVIYIISYAGHLYRVDRDENNTSNTKWTVLDNKYNYLKDGRYVEGFNLSDGAFRIVRSNGSYLQYSNDEGRTWSNSNVSFKWKVSLSDAVIAKDQDGNNRIAIFGADTDTLMKVYFSNDGITYTPSTLTISLTTHDAKIVKPLNSDDIYLFTREKSTSKIKIYKCAPNDSAYKLVQSPNFSFDTFSRLMGTVIDGKTHFYVAGNKILYYSSDGGATWITKTTDTGDGEVTTMHATKPGTVFKGNTDSYVSNDYGVTFSGFSHRLGWDVHYQKMYETKDGRVFQIIGDDFGAFISYTPENKDSYIQINNTAPTQMCYDADYSPNYNTVFTSNQDRGTRNFSLNSDKVYSGEIRSTDAFRVTVADDGASVWTWLYFGSLYHKDFAMPNPITTNISFTGNWWAAPLIPSIAKKEDAVYVAAGSKLKKITYNPSSKKIIQTEHYFDFGAETNSEIGGLSFSPLDPNKWYVSTKNGDFLYSENGGQTFNHTTTSLDLLPKANTTNYGNWKKNQQVIKASALDKNTVYYAGVGNKFLISKDGGKTFVSHTNGLSVFQIRELALSSDEKFIYAAAGFAGPWVYSVDKDKWFSMVDASVPTVDFTNVGYMTKINTVIFSTFGSGLLKFKIDNKDEAILAPIDLNIESVTDIGNVNLKWKDQSDNETGFVIERSINGEFEELTKLAANTTSYTDTTAPSKTVIRYRVKAVNTTTQSFYSNYVIAKNDVAELMKKKWTLVSVDSEESVKGGKAIKAFDNDSNTVWHTQWYNVDPAPNYPHTLVIDMNNTITFKGFSYLPRQDGQENGMIKDYEFYTSTDNLNWTLVKTGTWEKSKDIKNAIFDKEVTARYIKLVALSEVNGKAYASCAELSVFRGLSALPAPQLVQGGRLSDIEVELVWLDLSQNEDGFKIEELVNGKFSSIASVYKNTTKYTIENASSYAEHKYRVTAFNNTSTASSETFTVKAKEIPDNIFSIETISETCAGKANGKISIVGLNSADYTLEVNKKNYTFSKYLTIENLPSGKYDFCIKIKGDDTFEQCYSVQIDAGKTFDLTSKIVSNTMAVEVSEGTAPYLVFVNGQKTLETNHSSFSVAVKQGDSVAIKTTKDCEGTISKIIDFYEAMTPFPNPTKGAFEIMIPTQKKNILVNIYNTTGSMISSKTYEIINGKISLNLAEEATGVYFVKVQLKKPVTLKILKQ